MKSNRREFLKLSGLLGAGMFSGSLTGKETLQYTHRQDFNMAGYAAPKLSVVRVGVIGLGSRGSGTTKRLTRIQGVEVKAICDLLPKVVEEVITENNFNIDTYSGRQDSWKELCDRDDIDLVVINTPWHLHAPQAIYAMEQNKHVAVEVPVATTIEDCWKIVETSEKKQRHCMMLANPCYRDLDMMALSMARDGYLGEVIHGEGAYIHDLRRHNFSKTQYQDMWRLKQNASRNGNLYPTHGFGTICNIMNINCGDRLDYMVSVSSSDFMMANRAKELAEADPFYEPYADESYRGNMNTSIIRTKKGRTIVLQHDVTSPRPGVRFNLISGTNGIAEMRPPRVATSHEGWLQEEKYDALTEKYTPNITKRVGKMASKVGGHGGMDTMMLWRLIDCLRNGLPLDMSVYDGVLWSAMAPLSEYSVANQGESIDVPDFTSGSWKTNKPGMDIELKKGGTTKIL